MLCESCQKRKATVHYTEIVKNQMVKINLCESCAKEKGIELFAKFTIADLLSGLTNLKELEGSVENKTCESCGMAFSEFKNTGRFGCPACYISFEDILKQLFESIHKASRHVGKIPKHWNKSTSFQEQELKELEKLLHQAILNEAFEEAARLRDQIKSLKEPAEHKTKAVKPS